MSSAMQTLLTTLKHLLCHSGYGIQNKYVFFSWSGLLFLVKKNNTTTSTQKCFFKNRVKEESKKKSEHNKKKHQQILSKTENEHAVILNALCSWLCVWVAFCIWLYVHWYFKPFLKKMNTYKSLGQYEERINVECLHK